MCRLPGKLITPMCSVNFEDSLKVAQKVKKGDMLGYFLFGGSDFMMVFQKKAGYTMEAPTKDHSYKKLLMGERYGRLGTGANTTKAK